MFEHVLNLLYNSYFLFTGVERCRGCQKKETLGLDEIKQKLVELVSIIVNDTVENDDLKKKAEEGEEPEKAAEVMKECEIIIKTNKKGIVPAAYYQGKAFKKFKDKEKFSTLVNKLKIHKTTIAFTSSAKGFLSY